jgi:hypothetical protein
MRRMIHSRLAISLALVLPLVAACGGSDETTPQQTGSTTDGNGGTATTASGGAGGAGGAGTTGTGGTATTTASGGAGGTTTTGAGGALPGGPIVAPNEEWTWVGFDNAFCANNTPTGIGVNLTNKSKDVVIYLQGGGACWNQVTCYTFKQAVNIEDGYDEASFKSDVKGSVDVDFFSRTKADNPFKDASFVFVPYCTGDVHAGSKIVTYGSGANAKETHHVGGDNFKAYLARIVDTFPDAEHILVSGSSAGGYGAGFNFWRVKEAFPNAKVDLLDDSGPPLPKPYLKDALRQQWLDSWDLAKAFPPGCTECVDDFDKLFNYYGVTYPESRGALMSYMSDGVISMFFSVPKTDMPAALDALATGSVDPYPSMQYFYVTGDKHTFLGGNQQETTKGVVLADWIKQFWTGDAAWASVHP